MSRGVGFERTDANDSVIPKERFLIVASHQWPLIPKKVFFCRELPGWG